MIATWGVALLLLIAAVVTDLRTYRVPNGLVVSGMIVGGILFLLGVRPGGVFYFLGDLMGPMVLLYPVYRMRGIGAGDVKLCAALATIVGARHTLFILIISFFIGGIWGVSRWILQGQLCYRLHAMRHILGDGLSCKQSSAYYAHTDNMDKLHFTVCILLAFVGCMTKEAVM